MVMGFLVFFMVGIIILVFVLVNFLSLIVVFVYELLGVDLVMFVIILLVNDMGGFVLV